MWRTLKSNGPVESGMNSLVSLSGILCIFNRINLWSKSKREVLQNWEICPAERSRVKRYTEQSRDEKPYLRNRENIFILWEYLSTTTSYWLKALLGEMGWNIICPTLWSCCMGGCDFRRLQSQRERQRGTENSNWKWGQHAQMLGTNRRTKRGRGRLDFLAISPKLNRRNYLNKQTEK